MEIVKYINLLKNTVQYDLPNHVLQQIINRLVKAKIVTYNESNDPECIKISAEDTLKERVNKLLEYPEKTLNYIEDVLINKGYRYSIYYQCEKFELNKEKYEYNSLDSYNPLLFNSITDFFKPILIETDERIILKFSKSINQYFTAIDTTINVLYPTLWIYHKNINILEHRFDSISFKNDDNFYKITLDAQLEIIKSKINIDIGEFRTNALIEEIVNNRKDEVHLISQDIGLKRNSSAKLKVGTNMVMPFIGDLEELIDKNREFLFKDKDSTDITNIFVNYIKDIKKNAKYKSRLLSWYNDKQKKMNVNVTFSYRNERFDLYNFLEVKKVNMELMNYAIEYISSIYRDRKNS